MQFSHRTHHLESWLARSVLLAFLLLANMSMTFAGTAGIKDGVLWTMVNVNHSPQQGDAHVLRFSSGEVILIDAAHYQPGKDMLVPFLLENRIKKIDYFIASHPHKDHYQGIKAVLEAGISVSNTYFNIPNKAVCDGEVPWGCDYTEVLAYLQMLKNRGSEVKSAVPGTNIVLKNGAKLTVLYAFDGVTTPVGSTDVNDLSLVMRLDYAGTRVLFTGDLNNRIGTWLASNGKGLQADILKFPHHGTENAAPDAFYSRVAPRVAMVPSPSLLWCSSRSERMKKWVKKHRVSTYVNGFAGDVHVRITQKGYAIQTQHSARVKCHA